MAKIPSLQRLLVEDFPNESQWIQKLIGPLNDFMENDIYALSRNLTFFDNIKCQIQTFQVQGATTFSCDTTQNSSIISNLSTTVGFYPNMPLQGLGIASNTIVTSFSNRSSIVANTTLGSNVLTNITSTSSLMAGQQITGNGISANTVLLSIDSLNQVHMSTAALATTSNLSIACASAAILSSPVSETNYGVVLVGGGAFPVSFNCTLFTKPSFLWVVNAVENSSNPMTLTTPVFCDWSYIGNSIVIENITGLTGSLVNGVPRSFNVTVLVVLT